MTRDVLEARLRQIGLEEKETKVYLATLELGPSPVQNIAQRARVARATTYLVLGVLKRKGLVTTFDRGKRTFFVAESPQQLNVIVAEQVTQLQYQQHMLQELIPQLDAFGQFKESNRPVVRYYEGAQALRSYIRDMLAGSEEVLGIFSHDDAEQLLRRANLTWADVAALRKRAKTTRRSVYTWRKTPPDKSRQRFQEDQGTRYLSYNQFPCQADIAIRGNRVGFIPYSEMIRGVIIDDAAIASMMTVFFERLWKDAAHSTPTVKK